MDGDGELRLSLMATLAQEESRKVSERVRAGQKISRDNGVLYGSGNILEYDRKAGESYTINFEQDETVRMIFDLYEQGLGMLKIAKLLQERKRLTASGNMNWTSHNVGRILKNATYKGYICYNKSYVNNYLDQKRIHNYDSDTHVLIKGDFEPIISEEQWEHCNKILAQKCRTTKSPRGEVVSKTYRETKDLWASKLRCSCGARFRKNRFHKDKDGNTTYKYVCYNQVNNGKASERERQGLSVVGYCDEPSVAEWKMEMMADFLANAVWQSKKDLLLSKLDKISGYYKMQSKKNSAESVNFLDAQIDKVEKRIRNLITMFADGDITRDEFAKMKADYTDEIKKLTEQKERCDEQQDILERCSAELSAVAHQLGNMLEMSAPIIDREKIAGCVRSIVADNRRYIWNINLNKNVDFREENGDDERVVIDLDDTSEIVSLFDQQPTPSEITQSLHIQRLIYQSLEVLNSKLAETGRQII